MKAKRKLELVEVLLVGNKGNLSTQLQYLRKNGATPVETADLSSRVFEAGWILDRFREIMYEKGEEE